MSADASTDSWLVVIDPQVIFAAPESPWGSPMFDGIVERVRELVAEHDGDDGAGRVIVTRFVPSLPPTGSWVDYYEAWPFAAVDADDPLYSVVPALTDVAERAHRIDAPTFGKWGDGLRAITGHSPRLVLAGVSTDCCVIATALAACDAGAHVEVVADACAGSSVENHERALDAMRLFGPQIVVR